MSRRRRGVVVALLFLASTTTFLVGSALVGRWSSGDGSAGGLVAGVTLEACTALAVLAIALVVRPVLRERTPRLATGYLLLRGFECATILSAGTWFVSTHTPWSQYELAVYAATGAAGLVLSSALLLGCLVPRALAVLGLVGYTALLAGGVLEATGALVLGSPAGGVLLAPGAVFEVALPVWLLVKGFGPSGPAQAVAQATASDGASSASTSMPSATSSAVSSAAPSA